MTKKLTWEVEKTSLVLRVSDSGKTTTWTLRPKTQGNALAEILQQIASEVFDRGEHDLERAQDNSWARIAPNTPMIENVRTVDAEELAELQRYNRYETTEEASRAAQAAAVKQLEVSAKWFDVEDDTYAMPIPDFDTGEIRPR